MKKRKLFAILLAMTLALSCVFVACDGGKNPPEPTTYTVTFNLNGAPGTAPAAQTVEEGNKASKPTNPNWTGYVFGGWYTDAACTTEWTFTTDTVTKDTTLYAKWTVEQPSLTQYTVTFNLNGAPGTVPNVQNISEGETATEPTKPSWTGYVFGGWYTDAACTTKWDFATPVTGTLILYAKWTAEQASLTQYTVTFNLNGAPGTVPNVQNITEGETATEPTEPTWDDKHIFGGWFTDAACTNAYDFSTPVTGALVLYAKWAEVEDLIPVVVTYTVTFNLNGAEGTVPEAQTINEGETATEPAEPAWDGYNFNGWFTDAECTTEWNFDSVITSDLTLYAKWVKQEVTITLHGNGGTFNGEADATYTVANGAELDPYENDLPSAARIGHHFTAWYIDAECTIEWDGTVTEGLELWAGWEAAEFDIEFNANFGTFPIGATKYITAKHAGETLSEQEIASITEPTKFGYDFAGWYTDVEGTTTWDFSATLTGEEIFYAKWVKKTGLVQEDYVTDDTQFGVIGHDIAGTYVGTIDGKEVEIKVIAYALDENGGYEHYGKIEWEGHIVNIKSKSGYGTVYVTVEIDGVEVVIRFLNMAIVMEFQREGYETISFDNQSKTGVGF